MKMPKIHGLEDHFIAMVEQWNGTGNFLDDSNEQGAHQFGSSMKKEKRTSNMRDQVRAMNSHSKWEWADKMSSDILTVKGRGEKEDQLEAKSRI
jgi:hypothetical protein